MNKKKLEQLMIDRGVIVSGGYLHHAYETIKPTCKGRQTSLKIQRMRKASVQEINAQNDWNIKHGLNEFGN